jgi:hypothetical protein
VTQYFAYQRFRLWRAPLHTRVLLSLFNVTVVLGAAVGVLMYHVRTGLTPGGAGTYYLGNEGSAAAAHEEMRFARSVNELLDVTHDHAFSEPLLFFVLCHLFALTRVSDRWKIAVYSTSFAAVVIDLGVPYLIRFVSPGFGWLQVANSAVMAIALAALLWVPTHEMWFYREPGVAVDR